ncbi:MAG: hypothetical protein FD147_2534 [Chloroflexi bacterium]|nr:MAG: hypothetical protein FD147_2534 [Chloroflexota bacterium]MBA4376814.1 hypothetical protein [Anaerolinea sp.]
MNKATRVIAVTLGTIFGISGISHGLFETLQGNTLTGGLFISAIGEAYKMWPHGNEYAFTLIPNFLITGIVAMIVGLAIIIWSVGFVHKKNGSTIFILLFVLLLLVGGGIAQTIFFPLIWGISTRINKPLTWWRKILPVKIRESLGKVWPWSLIVSSSLIVFVLEIAIFGFVPTVNDPDVVLSIMLACLGAGYGVLLLTLVAGFAHDIAMRPNIALNEK